MNNRFEKQAKKKVKMQDYASRQENKILNFNFKKWLNKNLSVLVIFSLLTFAVYFNSLGNEFVSDDISGILENNRLTSFNYILSNSLGFVQPLIYYLTVIFFGKSPLVFRLINLSFHLGNVFLIFFLISLLYNSKTAFISAVFFAVHPLLSESVVWISGGSYLRYGFFTLLTLIFFIFSSKGKKFLGLSFVFFIFALESSEKAIVVPLILSFYLFAYEKNFFKKGWKTAPFWGLSLFWAFLLRANLQARIISLQTDFYQKPQALNPLIQIPVSLASYLKLIFWPKNLTLYHSEMNFSSEIYLLMLAVFLIYLGIIFLSFFVRRDISFWLSFLIIVLLPTLTPLGISWIVAERYVYLGLPGILVVVSLIFKEIYERFNSKNFLRVIFVILVSFLAGKTINRNSDWQNHDTLWVATAKTSPSSPQNHNNLGDMYSRHGDFEKAINEFKIALELQPGYADAFHNLGNAYQQDGKTELAVESYLSAIKYNPRLWQSHQALAAIYFNLENYDRAREEISAAINLAPGNSYLHLNKGVIFLKEGKKNEARQSFETAIKFDPSNEEAKRFLKNLND